MQSSRKIFSDIYDRYVTKIYRFIFLKVGDQQTAEDLTSEVFLRAWRVVQKKPKAVTNMQAFIYQIARNLLVDHYRQKAQAQLVSAEELVIPDLEQDVEARMAIQSDMEAVRTALANLKEEYREAIVWYYLDELSAPEIAKITGKSEESIRVTIHRALNALREHLDAD